MMQASFGSGRIVPRRSRAGQGQPGLYKLWKDDHARLSADKTRKWAGAARDRAGAV
jgi:hypothetical protein